MPSRRFMSITACFEREDLALGLAQAEEQSPVVGRGAQLHQRPRARMYSWMAALIHHTAYVANLKPRSARHALAGALSGALQSAIDCEVHCACDAAGEHSREPAAEHDFPPSGLFARDLTPVIARSQPWSRPSYSCERLLAVPGLREKGAEGQGGARQSCRY